MAVYDQERVEVVAALIERIPLFFTEEYIEVFCFYIASDFYFSNLAFSNVVPNTEMF